MASITVERELLERLLDPADAALRAKVLTDLLDRPVDDRDVVQARKRIVKQPWVKATLDAHNGDGTWGRGFYHKYDGTNWVLQHLSEVGAPMEARPIRAGVKRLLDEATPVNEIKGVRGAPFRDLKDGVYWKYPFPCLVAHMAMVLIRAGHADHEITRAALNTCRHRFEPEQGFGCFVSDDSLVPACVMTVPKVLKAFLALPKKKRRPKDRDLIKGMVGVLKGFNLYEYVPRDATVWQEWAHSAKVVERREEKPRWIAAGRVEPRRAKAGWERFSFPLSYNSDLLEVLLLIGEADGKCDAVIDAGLEIVKAKRGEDGMWKMVGGLNGRMHARLDQKGKSSPWITYRALLAFKQFGQLELPVGF